MLVDRSFVLEQELFVSPMSNRHDIDVSKFFARFPPVAMSQNVVPSYFASGFRFTTPRYGPMEKSVEPRHTHTAYGRFDMLEKGRKTPDYFPAIERFRDLIKLIQCDLSFPGPPPPR